MKFRFCLKILSTEEEKQYPTLKKIAQDLNLEYHEIQSIIKSKDKLFLHPKIEKLSKLYEITKL